MRKVELLFLGTGAGEFWPSVFCKCSLCRRARKERVFRIGSCLLLDKKYLIDLPPNLNLAATLQGLSLREVTHIFITHSHQDHFDPIQLEGCGRDKVGKLIVYANKTLIELLPYYRKFNRFFRPEGTKINFQRLNPFREVIINNRKEGLKLIPILANHDLTHEDKAFNFIIEYKGYTLLYGCDTGWYPEKSWSLIRKFKFDVVILDLSFPKQKGCKNGHLSLDYFLKAKSYFKGQKLLKTRAKFIAQHIAHYPFQGELKEKLSKSDVILAYDGMRLII